MERALAEGRYNWPFLAASYSLDPDAASTDPALLRAHRADHADKAFHLGMTAVELGEPRAALPHFREAAAMMPAKVQYIGNLGVALMDAGELAESEVWLRRAVELAPTAQHRRPHEANLRLCQARAGVAG